MFRVAVVNSKGGAGKTTLATNLASYYCSRDLKTALIDYDSQGSCTFWHSRRPQSMKPVQVIAAYKQPSNVTRNWYLRPDRDTERVIVDTPSGLKVADFRRNLHDSDAILIPVLPSAIDIHAVSRFIGDILIQLPQLRQQGKIAVVANRARKNTLVYRQLEKFLRSLGIPFIATLRDTQQYIKASEAGRGIFEMTKVEHKDKNSWRPLLDWLQLLEANSEEKSAELPPPSRAPQPTELTPSQSNKTGIQQQLAQRLKRQRSQAK